MPPVRALDFALGILDCDQCVLKAFNRACCPYEIMLRPHETYVHYLQKNLRKAGFSRLHSKPLMIVIVFVQIQVISTYKEIKGVSLHESHDMIYLNDTEQSGLAEV